MANSSPVQDHCQLDKGVAKFCTSQSKHEIELVGEVSRQSMSPCTNALAVDLRRTPYTRTDRFSGYVALLEVPGGMEYKAVVHCNDEMMENDHRVQLHRQTACGVPSIPEVCCSGREV